jgi:hypothetical protein
MVVRRSTGSNRVLVRHTLLRRICTVLGMVVVAHLGMSTASAGEGPSLVDEDTPPTGSYVWVPPADMKSPTEPVANGQPHVLFLNRCEGGQTVTAGWPDDSTIKRSGILHGTVNFPPFPFGDAAWEAVLEHTREIFAPFNVAITDVDPSPASHDAAIVCGSGALAGFSGAGGVAPFTCGVIQNPITFTFPESLGNNPRLIAEVIAQEAAHAWGLDHSYKCEDPMTYLSGCGPKSFQDGDYPCGEYSPRSCQCGGGTQNTFAHIMGLFGPAVPDMHPPTAAIMHPHDGQIFEVGADFDIRVQVDDDVGVTLVSLYVNGELVDQDSEPPFGPWPVIDIPEGVYDLQVEAFDASGKTGISDVVRVQATPGGVPPKGGGDGDDAPGDDGGPPGGNGGIDDPGEDGTASDALPPGFGPDADLEGCACSARSSGSMGALWLAWLLALRRARRPRHRSWHRGPRR